MPESELYNSYLVSVAPPKPNTVETETDSGVMYTQSPLANGRPAAWVPAKKTLVVSLRRKKHQIKPVVCAAFLLILAVVAVVLLINALLPQLKTSDSPNSQSSDPKTPETHLDKNRDTNKHKPQVEVNIQPECGVRPAYSMRRRKRIVNGDMSWEGQWPWQVALEYRGRYRCGGVVVASDWVMTAAHCVYLKPADQVLLRMNASLFTIHAGSTIRNQTKHTNPNVQIVRVEAFYVHKRYASESRIDNYDIAMLKLERPLNLTSGLVVPACLPSEQTMFSPADECYLASWGSIRPHLFLQVELMHIEMPILTKEECYTFASTISRRNLLQVNPQKFCAGIMPTVGSTRAGACQYDSGSGLVCWKEDERHGNQGSWYVVGLVSGGNKCGEVNFYTNVTTMMDFIQPLVDGHLPSQILKCDEGQTSIWSNQVCDGHFDCKDLSDEQECECSETQFRCDNGLCKMDLYYHCNGVDDCGDGSDERNCSYFDCEDRHTDKLPMAMVCDSNRDCFTLKDELNCECSPTQFRCANTLCVPEFRRCNGEDDCMDGSDELNCECTEDQIDCGNSRCVTKLRVCDTINDCGNFKDEDNCTCIPDYLPCEPLGLCMPSDTIRWCQDYLQEDSSASET